MFFLSWQRWE